MVSNRVAPSPIQNMNNIKNNIPTTISAIISMSEIF
jgi:hypothetical protein